MAPVSILELDTFECARCGGTIDRHSRPRTCPHCQAKKADRCQLCDRAVYIGAVHCPEHAAAVFSSSRTTAMQPPASPDAPAHAASAPKWVATVARVAIAASILAPAGMVVRSQTSLRTAESFDDLRRLMVSNAPSPYEPVPDAESGRGPLDVERIVAEDIEGPAVRQFLADAGLLRGYGRLFRDPAHPEDNVSVEVYQYETSAGARSDMARADRVIPRLAAANELSWLPFGVDTVPGARGYSLVSPDGALSMQVVTFARGSFAVGVAVTSADQEHARDTAIALAEAQRAKLSKLERVEQLVVDAFRHIRD
jgi:hypothetical protein